MEEQLVCKVCDKKQTDAMKKQNTWQNGICDTCLRLDESERKDLYETTHPNKEYPGKEEVKAEAEVKVKVKKPRKEQATTEE